MNPTIRDLTVADIRQWFAFMAKQGGVDTDIVGEQLTGGLTFAELRHFYPELAALEFDTLQPRKLTEISDATLKQNPEFAALRLRLIDAGEKIGKIMAEAKR